MRIMDAIGSLQLGKKKQTEVHKLCTVWSECAEDGPDAVPLPEYPRPQLRRREWQCLNGWWEYGFRRTGEAMGEADGRILVPFSPETARSGVERTLQPGEVLWYRKKLGGLHLQKGKRLLLHFGAVDEACAVWWNGAELGSHRNGYLAFSFDVTEAVREKENLIEVCVRDETDRGTACRGKQTLNPGGMYYHAQSGIWQTVWLETVPEQYLSDLRITPLPEEKAVELELRFAGGREEIKSSVPETEQKRETGREGETGRKGDTEQKSETGQKRETGRKSGTGQKNADTEKVRITVWEPDASSKKGGKHYTAVKRSGQQDPGETKNRMLLRIPVPEPKLWSPETPYLYSLRIEAGADAVESYFAMRSFGTGEDPAGRPCLTLNGKPYFFHGVLDQGYWPESLMTPPADEAMIHDITQMKELGFNMLRKHVKIEPARWYWHCDRLGMVVWQDMVNGGGPVRKMLETYLPTVFPALGTHLRDSHYRLLAREDAGARRRFERDLRRMIRQLYSCPCVGLWTIFNEGWGQFDALRLAEAVRKEDPTRPVDHASGWFDQGGGDVRSVHNYFRPLTVEKDRRAFVLSEYGGADCSVAGHAMSEEVYGYQTLGEQEFPEKFRDLTGQALALSEQGLSGAVYTQVSDIEEETNGLLTYDRKVRKV